MSTNPKTRIVPPNAGRMIAGMRDTGYSISTAVADLVDNSISADATTIEIYIEELIGDRIRVAIIDDGCGMNSDELISAMTYGSPPRTSPKSLGKFGLGLKTASSAFALRFSAISRPAKSVPAFRATWDLDHVEEIGEWEMETVPASNEQIELLERVAMDHGTLILWERVDRLFSPEDLASRTKKKNALQRIESELLQHLAVVFQRFLLPNDSRLDILVNGQPVVGWDPFCETEEKTIKLLDHKQAVQLADGSEVEFRVRGFVLPRPEEFSTEEAAKRAQLNNDNQGIFVFREDRLIHGPDWMRIVKKEPHFSLARIDLSFDHRLDEAFNVDIKKSRILLTESLLNFMAEHVLPVVRNAANQRYREGRDRTAVRRSGGIHASANAIMGQYEDEISENKIVAKDAVTGLATIQNVNGNSVIRLLSPSEQKPDEPYVVALESLRDFVLWEPTINDSKRAVALNTSHPFYQKVYLPTKQTDIVIQSFDYLIWALAIGEMNTINDRVKTFYEDLRISVSRALRTLSERLPDVDFDDET